MYFCCGCATPTASEAGGEPVKRISALLSTHPIGDTDGSVLSLLFPNTFAPLASDDPPVLNLMIFQERVQLVKNAILQCGFTDQVCTILAMRLDDQDYAVISKAVDLDRAQVRKLLSTAIKAIRQRLESVITEYH